MKIRSSEHISFAISSTTFDAFVAQYTITSTKINK